jgi:hypothetical protein
MRTEPAGMDDWAIAGAEIAVTRVSLAKNSAFDSHPDLRGSKPETAYLLTVGGYKKVSGRPFPSVSFVAFLMESPGPFQTNHYQPKTTAMIARPLFALAVVLVRVIFPQPSDVRITPRATIPALSSVVFAQVNALHEYRVVAIRTTPSIVRPHIRPR